ncbi:hypothetical protein OS493_031420 [Desmophyllum pertusum]|uniref:Helicase Helix-turn-helix domain-containing protein n=1 Tax=Desmophyllum pertusum TaxID=174260 RepID=A0A9W9ZX19_9CNID|nr:hypothetical protein OS493_031420 [Desmophyllum pertusum]
MTAGFMTAGFMWRASKAASHEFCREVIEKISCKYIFTDQGHTCIDVKMADRKILVAEEFKKGKSLQEIADQIRVAKATAEIYGMDAFAAGIPLDHNQLAAELGIEDHQFHAIKKCIQCNVDFKLRTVKDSLEVYTYNQIRFIIGV